MNIYLEGYLASIPASEYNRIVEFLKRHAATKLNISEEEFSSLLEDLIQQKEKATRGIVALSNERPMDTYNKFFNLVSVDVNYLFKIIDALYNSIDNYSYLSSSYLSDVKGEIEKLSVKVKELRTKRQYDNNTIIISETFKNSENFEQYNQSTEYLFSDRDGAFLLPVDIIHNNSEDMISLSVKGSKDLIHNKNGKTTAIIEVLDFRGIPIDTYASKEYGIDNSDLTYWDCSVVTDRVISTPLDNLPPGGAYLKFKIHLAKSSNITEISITPHCIYPVEVLNISISGGVIPIPLNQNNISSNTMTFNIPPVSGDEIEITIRQRNYVYDVITANEKNEEAEELWNISTNTHKESYLSKAIDNFKYEEDEIYLKYMLRKENEVEEWNRSFIRRGGSGN